MPLRVQQHEHSPPCSDVHRCCIMLRAIGSSQTQVIFSPPWHFSNLKVQRGTMSQFALAGATPGTAVAIPGTPCTPVLVRSIITVLVIPRPPSWSCPLHPRALLPPSFGRTGDGGHYRQ